MKIPENVAESVSLLLAPYGVDFKKVMSEARNTFGKEGKIEVKYMTPTQASTYCGLSSKTIRDKALAGEIESTRLGNLEQSRVLILKSSLDEWLEDRAVKVVKLV